MGALVFSLHGSRPEAVTWIAGRFDLLMTLFVLVSFLLFIRYRETGVGSFLWLSVGRFAMAVLIKESAFCLPFLLGLYLYLRSDWDRGQLRCLLPHFGTAILLFAYRWQLLGGIGGYKNPETGLPEILDLSLLSSLKALTFRLWAVLLFPVNWSVEPHPLVALLLVLSSLAWIWLVARNPVRSSHLLLALGFTLLAALPALPQLLIGPNLEKDRLLYLPCVGLALLVGSLVGFSSQGLRMRLAVAVLVLFTFAALQHNLSIWKEVSERCRRFCKEAGAILTPEITRVVGWNLPGNLRGVYLFQNGFPECLERFSDHVPGPVEILQGESPPDADADTVVFSWNVETEELWTLRR